MTTQEQAQAQRRQYYHRLLLNLGEAKYKDVIVQATFRGATSTTELTETQMSKLIEEAEQRLGVRNTPQRTVQAATTEPEQATIRNLRNKCLQVLSQRGIISTPKDWSLVNKELEAKRYQWILTDEQRQKGYVNKRGIGTFNNVDDLKKLFHQLCSIRDNEKVIKTKVADKAAQN